MLLVGVGTIDRNHYGYVKHHLGCTDLHFLDFSDTNGKCRIRPKYMWKCSI